MVRNMVISKSPSDFRGVTRNFRTIAGMYGLPYCPGTYFCHNAFSQEKRDRKRLKAGAHMWLKSPKYALELSFKITPLMPHQRSMQTETFSFRCCLYLSGSAAHYKGCISTNPRVPSFSSFYCTKPVRAQNDIHVHVDLLATQTVYI